MTHLASLNAPKLSTSSLCFSGDRHDLVAGIGPEGLSVWTVAPLQQSLENSSIDEDEGGKGRRDR